ncbi:MAG TPA: glycosyltransferase family 39 protein [Myxococcota bacterium]|nr:glycosyltransferase family 39 protein [Myxococcota bacterium]
MSPTQSRVALTALLALVAAQGIWNAAAQRAFWGYDEGGHAGYALAIREQGLPHPLSGWSTFHPPAAHLVGAAAWSLAEPFGPRASLVALRLPSLLGLLAAVVAVFGISRRLGASDALALCAAAMCAELPVAQLAGSMIGNEGFCAGASALALWALVRLEKDPRRLRLAVAAGAFAGLAAASKYTGLWSVAACAVPFARRGLDRRGLRAAAACAACAVAVAGPAYLRNLAATGSLLPMTREREPMRSSEERLSAGARRVSDYLAIPWDCGRYPYVAVVADGGIWAGLNPAMRSVPCLAYAGLWFDPFGLRANRTGPRDGVGWGVALLYSGLVPTLVAVFGLGHMVLRCARSRGRALEAPLVAQCALGLTSFVAFTALAPSLAAAKSSYLLPLLAPGGAAFARGCALLPRPARRAAVALSLVAAALGGFVFTTGTVFAPARTDLSLAYWTHAGDALPGSWISEAARRLLSP